MPQKYADIIIDISHEGVDRPFQYKIPENLEEKIFIGTAVEVPFGRGNNIRTGYVIGISGTPEFDKNRLKTIKCAPDKSLPVEGKLIKLAAWMRENYGCTMISAIKTVMPVKEKVAKKTSGIELSDYEPELPCVETLNYDQKKIVEDFIHNFENDRNFTYLLNGITGSGKTEVYIKMAEKVIESGRDVIVLVPEIALTFQTIARFKNQFGERISFLNSRMSKGEKFREFEKARSGKTCIMVGPRSALFAPFQRLGLIILDEEHDAAYKSEQTPKYHARETAIARADIENASVVLGSATPSVRSYYLAKTGEYKLYELKNRATGADLAKTEIVDMREELHRGNKTIFSEKLYSEMKKAFDNKEQVMLFINRRGFHSSVFCRECGKVIKCPHCDVSLSLHRNGMMICHYCGFQMRKPEECPECHSKMIGSAGLGTEYVESEVHRMFPEIHTLRMDRDTTMRKDAHGKILEAFRKHEADCLVGTQMIVKGHDFPRVTVVGALLADLGLYDADYESAERTFDLLTQAAGRAGRGIIPGHVVIQTYHPENYAVKAAAAQDYEKFYEYEISYRKLLHYPPVWHMVCIMIASAVESETIYFSESISDILKNKFSDCDIIGPSEALIYRINDIFRRVIYIKAESYKRLTEAADEGLKIFEDSSGEKKTTEISFDFDPLHIV